MAFDLKTWRERISQQSSGWQGRWRQAEAAGVTSLYAFLSAMAVWPVVEAARGGEWAALAALGGVAGGVGGNLLANQIQLWQDEVDAAQQLSRSVEENADIQPALDAILESLEIMAQAQVGLSEAERDWFVQALRAELAQLGNLERHQAVLIGSGAVAQGEGAIAVGERGVVGPVNAPVATGRGAIASGRDSIILEAGARINLGTSDEPCVPLDDDKALMRYLHYVIEANRRLQLQGIRSAGGLVSIELEQIYVTLAATVQKTVTAEQAWLEELAQMAPGEARRADLAGHRETTLQVKVNVQEALAMYPRLVVLGDPGSGKTTLLRYLALTYARDLAGKVGLVNQRLGLDEQRLPVLLPLREFARFLEKERPNIGADGPKLLLDYLHTYFENQGIVLPRNFFRDRLQAGGCVILLDGVDEVADFAIRQRIARIIERFTLAYPDVRYIVTSRIVGYTGGARLGADYHVTTVRDFTQVDIERFAAYWNRAVEIALAGEETPFVLQSAESHSKTLLLAIQSNQRVRELAVNPLLLTVIALVQRYRAQLPERRTELYEEAVEVLLVQWDAVKGLSATAVLQGLELDAGDRRAMLEPIALWMMEQRQREIDLDDLRRQLAPSFYALTQDRRRVDKAVDGFVQLINERSGLLTERGQGVYAYSHLTFQEHLAARAVADRVDNVAFTLERLGDSWWREVVLLQAGYLSTQGKRRVTELIQAIMDYRQEPEPYHNLVLAAEALRDVGPARVSGDLGGQIQERLKRAFSEPLQKGADLSSVIRRRAAAAEALGRIESGGYGAQPAFWRLPCGEPVWVDIPAGEFWMGEDKDIHKVYIDACAISRVLITNAQYQFFVEAAGHRAPSGWEGDQPPKGRESHPVVNVTWRDALAYCRWLSGVTGKQITLPSEAQWEKAARGDQDRRQFPWGDQFKVGYCNSGDLGLGETSPVGVFSEGASPCGVLDLSGNVWEWCRTKWQESYQDYKDDNDLEGSLRRVLRGGAFYGDYRLVRCAARGRNYPNVTHRYNGFRVVASPV